MSWFLTIVSSLFIAKKYIDEQIAINVPAENWRNTELLNADKLNPAYTPEQIMKNIENGEYYLPDIPPLSVIDNMQKYNDDQLKYGFMVAYKWAECGKYQNKESFVKQSNGYVNVFIFKYPYKGIRVYAVSDIQQCVYDSRFFFVNDSKIGKCVLIKRDYKDCQYIYATTELIFINSNKQDRDLIFNSVYFGK